MPQDFKTINIEEGMPRSDAAIKRVTYELAAARAQQVKVLKFIHGYGSSGTGGRLRIDIRQFLQRKRKSKDIELFVTGEEWSIFDDNSRRIIAKCPSSSKDSDLERSNNGVTIVLL